MDLLLGCMTNAVLISPTVSHFPCVLFMWAGRGILEYWEQETSREFTDCSYRKNKEHLGVCVCPCVSVCVWSLIFQRGKKAVFLTCLLDSSFAFVQPHSFLKLSLCVFLSGCTLWSYVSGLCSFIKWCFSWPKKVIIAFEHDLFFSSKLILFVVVTKWCYFGIMS